jgi:hypothetical protein
MLLVSFMLLSCLSCSSFAYAFAYVVVFTVSVVVDIAYASIANGATAVGGDSAGRFCGF